MSGLLVGVLGGTGPAATAYFLQRLVERTEARCDQDHVRTLAFNDTAIPDRTAFLLGRSDRSPLAALIEDGQLLEACGCDLLALPCNTAHGFFDELQGALGIPVVHMVRETPPPHPLWAWRASACWPQAAPWPPICTGTRPHDSAWTVFTRIAPRKRGRTASSLTK